MIFLVLVKATKQRLFNGFSFCLMINDSRYISFVWFNRLFMVLAFVCLMINGSMYIRSLVQTVV